MVINYGLEKSNGYYGFKPKMSQTMLMLQIVLLAETLIVKCII